MIIDSHYQQNLALVYGMKLLILGKEELWIRYYINQFSVISVKTNKNCISIFLIVYASKSN